MVTRFLNGCFGDSGLVGLNVKVGFHERQMKKYHNKSFELTDDLASTISEIKKEIALSPTTEVYVAPVVYDSKTAKKENIKFIMAIVADFDEYGGKPLKEMRADEAEACREKMVETLMRQKWKPSLIVSSGNGLQVYWMLKEPLLVENKVAMIEKVQKMLANQYDCFKGDLAATALGHTLRLPGTNNCKDPDNIKECKGIYNDESVRYEFEALVEELNVSVPQFEAITSASEGMHQTYKRLKVGYDDVRKAAGQCDFFCHMSTNPELQSYMEWTHLALNLAPFEEYGRSIFHNISKKHPNYHFEESERHFSSLEEKVKDSGYHPTSCATICEAGFTCSKSCQQKSPAGMILSTLMKANKQQKLSVEIDLEVELKRIVPKLAPIDNMRLVNAFILEKINPSTESRTIKIAVLKEAMKILGIPERGNLKELTTMIKCKFSHYFGLV